MRHFRMSTLSLLVVGLCVVSLSLNGCGPKQESPAKKDRGVEKGTESVAKTQTAPVPSTAPITQEKIFYDFELADLDGWEIPIWAVPKPEYVAKEVVISDEAVSSGNTSMKVTADFPGATWTAALVEIQQFLNLSAYRVIRVDVYLPKDAPVGLKAKLILTVGNNWKFVEMSRSVPLIPGEWVTITANIEPGSYDWKRIVPDETFSEDVRKIAIRIESNNKPAYTGSVYVDNVRAGW
ncbi:glycan-binding surface protein [Candidatus Omnitrophota bacterium]